MKAASLSRQEKRGVVFRANAEVQACKQMLEFQKTCGCHDGLRSFLKGKDFPDATEGDIYKWAFSYELGGRFWKLCVRREASFQEDREACTGGRSTRRAGGAVEMNV